MATKRKSPDSPGTPSKRRRHVLTLADKVRVIDAVRDGLSQRGAAEKFNIGRTQVANIIASKETIYDTYTKGGKASLKYLAPRHMKHSDIDEKVWQFFCEARSKNIPVNGPMLQAEAITVAKSLGKTEFCGSNGWLESFADRHQLKMANLHGEGAEVSEEVVEQWMEKIPELCVGYEPKNIFNVDETGMFFRAVPTKSFITKDERAAGTKVLKERFTVLVGGSATGEKLKLWVVGRAKKPHSFPKNGPPANQFIYRHNSRGWMTSEIFIEFLNWLNNMMMTQRRKILLLLDNCPSHPSINLSNVKMVFLPKNTTAHLQPMDQGVIASLKAKYKRLMMTHICLRMKESTSVTDLAKKVRIYDAILRTKTAWDEVAPGTLVKCFARCGYRPAAESQNQPNDDTTEPDEFDIWFQNLLEVPWEEYLAVDDELEEESPARAPDAQSYSTQPPPNALDQDPDDIEVESITHTEALICLDKIRHLCASDDKLFGMVNKLASNLQSRKVHLEVQTNTKQSAITNFFSTV